MTRRPSEGDWLSAVGHPYRVEILRHFLRTGTAAAPSEIAAALRLPTTTTSHHVHALRRLGIVRLVRRTRRRNTMISHYALTDRNRVASIVWATRAELLVTDLERQNGRADVTVRLDADALAELRSLTASYLARIGELGIQTRERCGNHDALTAVAVLLATHVGGDGVTS